MVKYYKHSAQLEERHEKTVTCEHCGHQAVVSWKKTHRKQYGDGVTTNYGKDFDAAGALRHEVIVRRRDKHARRQARREWKEDKKTLGIDLSFEELLEHYPVDDALEFEFEKLKRPEYCTNCGRFSTDHLPPGADPSGDDLGMALKARVLGVLKDLQNLPSWHWSGPIIYTLAGAVIGGFFALLFLAAAWIASESTFSIIALYLFIIGVVGGLVWWVYSEMAEQAAKKKLPALIERFKKVDPSALRAFAYAKKKTNPFRVWLFQLDHDGLASGAPLKFEETEFARWMRKQKKKKQSPGQPSKRKRPPSP